MIKRGPEFESFFGVLKNTWKLNSKDSKRGSRFEFQVKSYKIILFWNILVLFYCYNYFKKILKFIIIYQLLSIKFNFYSYLLSIFSLLVYQINVFVPYFTIFINSQMVYHCGLEWGFSYEPGSSQGARAVGAQIFLCIHMHPRPFSARASLTLMPNKHTSPEIQLGDLVVCHGC